MPKLLSRRQTQQRPQSALRHLAGVGAHPVQDSRLELEQRQHLRHPRAAHPVLSGKVGPVDTACLQPRSPGLRELQRVEDLRPANFRGSPSPGPLSAFQDLKPEA
jgi:hypothetical protein